jgi:hypothetical protein
VVECSSEEKHVGKASAVLDGKRSTFWHTQYCGRRVAQYPHFLVIDLSETQEVVGFSVVQRETLSRAIKDVKLYKSLDGKDFALIGPYVLDNVEGTQAFEFDRAESVRFLKLVAESSWDGEPFAALSEIGLHGGT